MNQLKHFTSAAINQVGSQPAHILIQLLEAAQNPLDLLPNASIGINSIQSQFQVSLTITNMNQLSHLPFDLNVASVNQITNLPINDDCYDTPISSQGFSVSLLSISNYWTGVDNGDISSVESTQTDTTDEATGFQ